MKTVLLLIEGFEEGEALVPADILRRGNVDLAIAGVETQTVIGSHKIKVTADCLLSDINSDEVECVICPGGPGAKLLAQNWAVNELLIKTAQKGIVAAICASPAVVLAPCGLLEGKEATCYPACKEDFPSFNFSDDGVVVSGNIITAKSVGYSFDFGQAILEALKGKEVADKVAAQNYWKR